VRERLQSTGALYTLDLPALTRLAPDLLVTQALCEVCAVAEEEVQAAACTLPGRPRVLNLEPTRLAEVFDAIRQVAEAAGVTAVGEGVVAGLAARVAAVTVRAAAISARPRVALLEWLDPPFCGGHWNPELVRLAGGVEVLGREGERSRQVAWDDVRAAAPDVVVISCCGYDVERTLQDLPLVPPELQASAFVVNGSHYFSRPGPRLVDSLEILAHILHPDVQPLLAGLPAPLAYSRLAAG
jgi:iron complex transport system substrate-binding protein